MLFLSLGVENYFQQADLGELFPNLKVKVKNELTNSRVLHLQRRELLQMSGIFVRPKRSHLSRVLRHNETQCKRYALQCSNFI